MNVQRRERERDLLGVWNKSMMKVCIRVELRFSV